MRKAFKLKTYKTERSGIMKKIAYFSLVCLTLFPCFSFADVKMDMMNDKIDRLEQDLNALQRKVYQNTGKGNATTATPSVVATTPASSAGGNLDDLYARVDEKNAIIQDLTAKIEKLEFEQTQLNERINKLNADIDVRFNMMSNNTAPAQTATSSTPASTTSGKNAQADYDAAYALLKKGKYSEAESAFSAFMKAYPKSSLVGNANYWIGETYYARGKYEQAVGIFADGFTKYKNNSKAADNLLKLGLSMSKLKKKTEACTAFKSLPTEFPKASKELKDRAKNEAKKLACK